MALTGKQIRQLRSLAHHLSPAVMIGKNGIVEGTLVLAGESLEAHEIGKCAVQDGSGLTAREAGEELAARLSADLVQVIGRKFILYRPSSRDDVEHIQLEA